MFQTFPKFMVLVLQALPIYTLIEFLVGLDQIHVYADIQKTEGLIRCCLPLAQKLYNVPKGFIKEEVEKYFPGSLAFTDCTEQPIPIPAKNEKKVVLFRQEKETHAQSRICMQ
jgi:hypothetical protein